MKYFVLLSFIWCAFTTFYCFLLILLNLKHILENISNVPSLTNAKKNIKPAWFKIITLLLTIFLIRKIMFVLIKCLQAHVLTHVVLIMPNSLNK